jgi:hypothetical protein
MNRGICPTLSTSVLLLAVFAPAAMAATYTCPAPQSINCVPATSSVNGWKANGGQMTGNSFGPNNQCSNVNSLGPNSQRLVCCYVKCGVFLRDVKAKSCTKTSESQFDCQ